MVKGRDTERENRAMTERDRRATLPPIPKTPNRNNIDLAMINEETKKKKFLEHGELVVLHLNL